jgi:hypothetical protein
VIYIHLVLLFELHIATDIEADTVACGWAASCLQSQGQLVILTRTSWLQLQCSLLHLCCCPSCTQRPLLSSPALLPECPAQSWSPQRTPCVKTSTAKGQRNSTSDHVQAHSNTVVRKLPHYNVSVVVSWCQHGQPAAMFPTLQTD